VGGHLTGPKVGGSIGLSDTATGAIRRVYDAADVDRVRERWAAGGAALNAWLSLGAAGAGVLAAAGFDAVTLDLQHGRADVESTGGAAAAILAAGAVPFVRLRWNDAGLVMRALDLGARGVICPMVDAREQAEAFVRACRYPPLGARSYGPVVAPFGGGREHTEAANAAVLAFAQIETAEGLANVREIAAAPGLDGLYVGPADLSLTLGLSTFADLEDPVMRDALEAVVAASEAAGIVAGVHAPGVARASAMIERGFRFVGAAGDEELLAAAAADTLRRLRGA
jgi:4-hydroxy-2-oxoheptanedioate aldolase